MLEPSEVVPWETAQRSWLRAWLATLQAVMRSPSVVFAQLGPGPYGRAAIYGVSIGVLVAAAALSFKLTEGSSVSQAALVVITVAVGVPLNALIMAVVFHLLALLWEGRSPFSTALRTAMYASTASILFISVLLFGNTHGGAVAGALGLVVALVYGQRVTQATITRWYGLTAAKSWLLWVLTLVSSALMRWLMPDRLVMATNGSRRPGSSPLGEPSALACAVART